MMQQNPENNAEPGNPSAAVQAASLGMMLREARERLGLSVADVAAQIKFAPRQIEALEADDFKHLPEAAFLRGFVRSYAKLLQLDAETLFAAMPQTKTVAAELIPASVEVPFPVAHSSQRQNLILLGSALLLSVIVVGFAVWHYTTPLKQAKVEKIETPVSLPAEIQTVPVQSVLKQEPVEPSVSAEPKQRPPETKQRPPEPKQRPSEPKQRPSSVTEEQSPAQVVKPEMVQPAPQTKPAESAPSIGSASSNDTQMQTILLRMIFDAESWTEIKDKDGNTLSARIHPPGSEMNLHGHAPLSLVVGHAASVHLFKNGKPVDLAPYTNATSEVARLTLE